MSAPRATPWILLGTAVVLSIVLVVGAFNPAPHSGGDNAAYVSLAHALVTDGAYVDAYDPVRAPHTKYPPLFPALLAVFVAMGASTWVAFKVVVAALTVLGVGVTFLWAWRRLGAWAAFGVAVLVAASAATVSYSHWVLSDPLFVLLTILALWALERAWGGPREPALDPRMPALDPRMPALDPRMLALGLAAALGAYFTRSAGITLLLAVLGWLALERRFRALGAAALAFGLPAIAWWMRGRGAGVGDYASEFWLVDPYQPGLGTVGLGGLVERVVANAGAYLTRHGPTTVVGPDLLAAPAFGVLLALAAVVGWALHLRRHRPGPAELFLPLYLALILVWPEVWGGDRFLLPILPLVFAYGALALRAATRPLGALAAAPTAVAVALVLLPALAQWTGEVRASSACAAVVDAEGPWACYGPGVREFVDAAGWAGAALPEGAAVMSRKPRIFYVTASVPSRTFPFDPDPDVQLAEADRVGARYVLLDRWDPQAIRFVGGAVAARPGAFCFVRGFGQGRSGSTQLLGILPPELRAEGAPEDDGRGISIARCPEEYVAREPAPSSYAGSSSERIPLLSSSRP